MKAFKSLIFFLTILLLLLNTSSATANVDSLQRLVVEATAAKDLGWLYELHSSIGKKLADVTIEKYKESNLQYEKALKLAKELGDLEKMVGTILILGNNHNKVNNFQDALMNFNRVIEIAPEDDPKFATTRANAYTQKSQIYQALGDYEKAFKNQMQAFLIFEMEKDSLGIANSHYNIGTIFFYQNRYEKALESYEKAKVICDQIDNKRSIYACLAALGSVHDKLGKNDKSLEYNLKSLELAKSLNYKTGIAYAYGNIGVNYTEQKKFVEAEEALKHSIALKIELGDRWGVIGNEIDMSNLYLEWQKPKSALNFLEDAMVIAKDMNARSRQSDIYQSMAEVYDLLDQPLKAYDFTKKYVSLKDSLLNEKTVEEMGQSKRRFILQKSEHEIALLKKENEILEKNEEIQNQQFYILIFASIAFVLFLFWYKSKLNYQNKMNKLLEEKNSILNTKNDEIHIKNKQLEHSNEDLAQFAYVASHDLKEPLRMINSYTNLLQRRYNDSFDESGKEFMHYIVDAVSRMGILLDDILDFSRAGTQAAPSDFIDVQDVLFVAESNLKHRFETLNGTLIFKQKNFPSVKAHRTQLMQLLQNLISNGVKFKGERDPIVEVDGYLNDKGYVFSVKDNGIGISKENLEKVFEMFRRLHTREEYEGTGIGLATCKRIVTTWGGDIWVESVEGEGSTFFFSVPHSAPHSALQIKEKEQLEAVHA